MVQQCPRVLVQQCPRARGNLTMLVRAGVRSVQRRAAWWLWGGPKHSMDQARAEV
jgi:hypothetical protein